MHQLRYRHIFLKIIETDFVNSKTNSNKKGWTKYYTIMEDILRPKIGGRQI